MTKFGRHKCDAMPADFFADWGDGEGPTLHYEPDYPVKSGVSAYFTMEIGYCPFCGADLLDEKFETGC